MDPRYSSNLNNMYIHTRVCEIYSCEESKKLFTSWKECLILSSKGDICKICEKDGWLFATHSFTYSGTYKNPIYRVSHIEMVGTKWLWGVVELIILITYSSLWFLEVWIFECHQPFFKKEHRLASTTSNRKGPKTQPDISWFYQKTYLFKTSKYGWIQEPGWLKSSVVICQALETSAASLTSLASITEITSLASIACTSLFPQKPSWSWWVNHPWLQNDQCKSIFVHQNPIYLRPFVSEAIEANLCYFFITQISRPPEATRHHNLPRF